MIQQGFTGSSAGKEFACKAGDPGLITGLRRSPGEGIGYPLQCSGFPCGSDSKESACNSGDLGSVPWLGRSPGGGYGNPLQYSCLENPHGQRSLAGYSPRGNKESDMNEWLSTAQHDITNPLLGSYPKDLKLRSWKDISALIIIVKLFTHNSQDVKTT